MPKLGMEPIRRSALVAAAIEAIHAEGFCGVTVSHIASRAGVSTGLAHHYFGSKDQLLAATMRHLFNRLGEEVAARLRTARTPAERLTAIVEGNFAPSQFQPSLISAWLAFYMQSQTSPAANHLLRIYHRRLASNLAFVFRAWTPDRTTARDCAETAAALIDGLWLRFALSETPPTPVAAARDVERRILALFDGEPA